MPEYNYDEKCNGQHHREFLAFVKGAVEPQCVSKASPTDIITQRRALPPMEHSLAGTRLCARWSWNFPCLLSHRPCLSMDSEKCTFEFKIPKKHWSHWRVSRQLVWKTRWKRQLRMLIHQSPGPAVQENRAELPIPWLHLPWTQRLAIVGSLPLAASNPESEWWQNPTFFSNTLRLWQGLPRWC